jgi:hypothetical protein
VKGRCRAASARGGARRGLWAPQVRLRLPTTRGPLSGALRPCRRDVHAAARDGVRGCPGAGAAGSRSLRTVQSILRRSRWLVSNDNATGAVGDLRRAVGAAKAEEEPYASTVTTTTQAPGRCALWAPTSYSASATSRPVEETSYGVVTSFSTTASSPFAVTTIGGCWRTWRKTPILRPFARVSRPASSRTSSSCGRASRPRQLAIWPACPRLERSRRVEASRCSARLAE